MGSTPIEGAVEKKERVQMSEVPKVVDESEHEIPLSKSLRPLLPVVAVLMTAVLLTVGFFFNARNESPLSSTYLQIEVAENRNDLVKLSHYCAEGIGSPEICREGGALLSDQDITDVVMGKTKLPKEELEQLVNKTADVAERLQESVNESLLVKGQ